MTPLDSNLAAIVDEVSNALQTVVLLVEHLDRISSATARDVTAIGLSLNRATLALTKLHQAKGGAR
jgi:hypothetical protein